MATSVPNQVYGSTYGGNAAENYERFFVPAIGERLAADLVARARLREGERVLDVACGTGIVARLAADRVAPTGSVAGADLTAGMLAVARSVSNRAPVPMQWYETTAEAMPLPDDTYDVAFCQLGLMFIPNKAAAVSEMRRVLKPGGRAYVSVPGPTRFFDVLHQAFDHHSMPGAGAFVRLVFSLHDADELEGLFRGAGFSEVEVHADDKRLRLPGPKEFFWQYIQSTPLAAEMAQLDEKIRTSIEEYAVSRWHEWADQDQMSYTQPMLIAAARK